MRIALHPELELSPILPDSQQQQPPQTAQHKGQHQPQQQQEQPGQGISQQQELQQQQATQPISSDQLHGAADPAGQGAQCFIEKCPLEIFDLLASHNFSAIQLR